MSVPAEPLAALDVIVGFDGSSPSRRALAQAAATLANRTAVFHVVFVSHMPASSGFSPVGYAEVMEAQDQVAAEAEKAVAEILDAYTIPWSFERRSGGVADELLASARERRSDPDDGTQTILVVGRSTQALHHIIGSVPVALLHRSPYAVVV
ncbi:MAG: universal stress protein, partial [Acidimicrobiales bacterium]